MRTAKDVMASQDEKKTLLPLKMAAGVLEMMLLRKIRAKILKSETV